MRSLPNPTGVITPGQISSCILNHVIEHGIELFELQSISALSAVNQHLKSSLDSEWAWFHRCLKAGFVVSKGSSRRKLVIDWRELYRTHSVIRSPSDSFRVTIDMDDFLIKFPVRRSLPSHLWYSEIKSGIFRLTGEGVHIHHALTNAAIGNFFLPSQTPAFLRVLPCDCRGICKVPKKFPTFAVNFRFFNSNARLGLPGVLKTIFPPKSEITNLRSLVNAALPGETSNLTEISVQHPGGACQEEAGNLSLRRDLRLIDGEILRIEQSIVGNSNQLRVRREFWNETDASTYQGAQKDWSSAEISVFGDAKPKFFTSSTPRVLQSSRDARQCEFNPLDRKYLLVGRRSGKLALVDVEKDEVESEIAVDSSPILGLTWLNKNPRVAVYGASVSGSIGVVKFDSDGLVEEKKIGNFDQLSCVSLNCTDDFLMASGFHRDVALFDMHTKQKIANFENVHDNFINILKFSNTMPHVYSTCSFDASVKLWDLRMSSARSTATFRSPSLNVMCAFSPDDRRLLVSGMDNHVYQLSVQKGLSDLGIQHNILRRNSHTNYRRSVFLSGADVVATGGTDESCVRILNADTGALCAELDFTGTLARLNGVSELEISQDIRNPARLFGNLVSRLLMLGRRRTHIETTEIIQEFENPPRLYGEYVQSLRAHPGDPRKLAVLLTPYDRSADPVVVLADLKQTSAQPAPVLHAQGL